MERWFYSNKKKGGVPANLIDIFLKEHKVHGNLLPYFGLYQNVYTEMRFIISVEWVYMVKFADRLRAALLSVEYEYR